jgi:hypothetical protein
MTACAPFDYAGLWMLQPPMTADMCSALLTPYIMFHPSCFVCNSVFMQVLRALQPPLTADMCSTLLSCLQQCLAAADASHVAREVALELLLTLRSLLEALPARKLLLYPQVCDAGFGGLKQPYQRFVGW